MTELLQPTNTTLTGYHAPVEILKRDGRTESFDALKIENAIEKAGAASGEFGRDVARKFTIRVLNLVQQMSVETLPTVEELQDVVEEVLLSSQYKKTAKGYIIYREQHARLREFMNETNVNLVERYLERTDWQVKENSNMAYSLQGLNNYISSDISKKYWLNKIYSKAVRDAHQNGDFHIHDLNLLSVYCVGWDLQDLLREGFKGVSGKVESKPASHFRTALGQMANFFYTLQGEAAGAQAFANFDTLLAPFIRHDGIGFSEVKQALQEFIYNINVPTRVGFQTPFTNITMDLKIPEMLMNQPVIIGGKAGKDVYGDFQPEMDILNRAFLEVMIEGDAKGRVFTFPIPTYNISKNFDYDNPNLDLLWEVTATYGIPYFSNFVNSDMSPEDARSMCCRLRLDLRNLEKRGGGLFGANPLTGSVGVVTLNLPRLGFLSSSEDEFLSRLNQLMILAKESLELKRKLLEKLTDNGLYPYSKFYLRQVKQRDGRYWSNHFSTIGILGMNEACLNLKRTDLAHEAGTQFTLRVMDFMRERLIDFQEETGHHYNLEATPAEGTTFRLAKLDQQRYSKMRFADCSSITPYYSNSTQLPADFTDDIFEVLDLQDEIQTKYTGGTVLHLFTGEAITNPDSVKKLVKKICSHYKLPYFTVTPTFSVCPHHGYLAGEYQQCPECESVCEVYSRVVGYLRPVNQWNEGKAEEFRNRTMYQI